MFVQFSGHGTNLIDKNNDELDGRDECIITCEMNYILDDELKNIIDENLKPTCKLVCLIDCCHSGTMLDLKYNYLDSTNNDLTTINTNITDSDNNVIMISGCMDKQVSLDVYKNFDYNGAMTLAFLQSYSKNMSWKELILAMRDNLKKSKYEQICQLSSSNFIDLNERNYI